MAKFLIQNDENALENEKRFLLERISMQKYVHGYRNVSLTEVNETVIRAGIQLEPLSLFLPILETPMELRGKTQ